MFPMQGAQIRSLVGELRSQMPHGTDKLKKKKKNPVGKKIANIAAVTKSGQKQIVSEMKVDKGILLEVLACAMKTRLKGLGCVFFLN